MLKLLKPHEKINCSRKWSEEKGTLACSIVEEVGLYGEDRGFHQIFSGGIKIK